MGFTYWNSHHSTLTLLCICYLQLVVHVLYQGREVRRSGRNAHDFVITRLERGQGEYSGWKGALNIPSYYEALRS
jgi:hypothetical protein